MTIEHNYSTVSLHETYLKEEEEIQNNIAQNYTQLKVYDVQKENGYFYLATVYRLHPEGKTKAYLDASKMAALLLANKIPVFCPIVHSHYLNTEDVLQNNVDEEQFWIEWLDKIMVSSSKGVIVTKMENWEKSRGIAYEIKLAESLGKPVIYTDFLVVPQIG